MIERNLTTGHITYGCDTVNCDLPYQIRHSGDVQKWLIPMVRSCDVVRWFGRGIQLVRTTCLRSCGLFQRMIFQHLEFCDNDQNNLIILKMI